MLKTSVIINEIQSLTEAWEPRLASLPSVTIMQHRNRQNRTIKQILGHLVDSASNNIHRIVHLQYRQSPLSFPNYATNGNNDRWIAIQDYQNEDWTNLVRLWKYTNLHLCHVITNVDHARLENEWMSGPDSMITLQEMIRDYPLHLRLHLSEIEELINGHS